jgi:hypothetical protein
MLGFEIKQKQHSGYFSNPMSHAIECVIYVIVTLSH